jgi:hypothetical protein
MTDYLLTFSGEDEFTAEEVSEIRHRYERAHAPGFKPTFVRLDDWLDETGSLDTLLEGQA